MAYKKNDIELMLAKYKQSGLPLEQGARMLGVSRYSLSKWLRGETPDCESNQECDEELIEQNVRLAKQKQKAQDQNRIANKSFREYARVENAIEEYNKALVQEISNHSFNVTTIKHRKKATQKVGIIQFSDLHFNELVELEHNKYDFDIAGKRLYQHVDKALAHFKAVGVSHVVMAFTADLMNSDRRLDELLATATNRARATILSVDILQQAILHVNKDFNVTVSWINGNEGRVGKDVGFVQQVATDNYDETIMRALQLFFYDKKGVDFHAPDNGLESVLNILGHNILLIHGHTLGKNYQNAIGKVMAKYSARGVRIRYVLFGHIHEAYISENFARSGSPVGDNSYSDKALQLSGRASQNFYVVHKNGNIDGMKSDLQCYGDDGYKTNAEMHAYAQRKSEDSRCTIMKIVI